MKSWPDDDLILHLYGEHPRGEVLARAIATDPELAERFAALARDLAPFDLLEAPEPDADFEARLWRSLRPRLDAAPRPTFRRWSAPPAPAWRFALLAASLVAIAALAFWSGRRSATPPGPTFADRPAALSADARDRLLRASLAGHLENSGLLLTDLANAPSDGRLAAEREWAAALLASNRLYRLAAERAGQRRIVALLVELEPLLVELANHSGTDELGTLQQRIAEHDLLFKVRVVGGRLGIRPTASGSTATHDL